MSRKKNHRIALTDKFSIIAAHHWYWNQVLVWCGKGEQNREFTLFSFVLSVFAFFALIFLRAPAHFLASCSRARKTHGRSPLGTNTSILDKKNARLLVYTGTRLVPISVIFFIPALDWPNAGRSGIKKFHTVNTLHCIKTEHENSSMTSSLNQGHQKK